MSPLVKIGLFLLVVLILFAAATWNAPEPGERDEPEQSDEIGASSSKDD